EDVGEVRQTGEHDAPIGDGLGEVDRLAVDREHDIPQDAHVEAGRGDDDVGVQHLAGDQADPGLREGVDLIRHDGDLSLPYADEEVSLGEHRNALLPRAGG